MGATPLIRLLAAGAIALLLGACGDSTLQAQPLPDPADYAAGAGYMLSRWYGAPALWREPAPPINTEFRYYDVSGDSQQQLWNSMIRADLCSQYSCLPVPGSHASSVEAIALEGEIAPGPRYCYSPATFTFTYKHFIVLPRWTPAPVPSGAVSLRTVTAWNALLGVLVIHESRHAAIAEADIAALNAAVHRLPDCAAAVAFWENPHVFDQLEADQNAYHAQLATDCRPEIGCIPAGWMGWD